MQATFSPGYGRNWLYFGIRWLLLVGFTIAVFIPRLGQPPVMPPLTSLADILLAFGIGALATVLLAVFMLIPVIRPYIVFVKLPGDWLIALMYVYLAHANPTLILGICAALMVTGVL